MVYVQSRLRPRSVKRANKPTFGRRAQPALTWTTKKMEARISEDLLQDDATYRLTWMGFPVFIAGRSTPTGKFFPSHVTRNWNAL